MLITMENTMASKIDTEPQYMAMPLTSLENGDQYYTQSLTVKKVGCHIVAGLHSNSIPFSNPFSAFIVKLEADDPSQILPEFVFYAYLCGGGKCSAEKRISSPSITSEVLISYEDIAQYAENGYIYLQVRKHGSKGKNPNKKRHGRI